jgi:hypothetical protein
MPLIRLVVLLFVGGGLLLFCLQNLATSLPLVFLNINFLNLPVAVWVLTAFAAGVLTMLIIVGLASLGTNPGRQAPRPRRAKESFRQSSSQSFYEPPRSTVREPEPPTNPAPEPNRQTSWQSSQTTWQDDDSFTRDRQPVYSNPASNNNDDDDWEDASDWFDDGRDRQNDWDWDDEPIDRPRNQSRSRDGIEDEPPPKSNTQPSSTYSFGYQNPGGSGVGKTEPVVDADYRVIVPPYRSLDDVQDDDFADDNRDRPLQP